ncbi:MAG: YitT family protein, partial [Angelakisella sp.]
MKKENTKRIVCDIAIEVIGSFMIAIGFYNFAVAAKFPMTGFSGIALILYRLFGLPIGMSTIVLNIPVAILCYRLLGRGFFIRSVRCMIISSLFMDYVAPLFPVYEGDRMLAAICTGIFAGFGYALVYMRNSSTGGSDFIIMSVKALRPHISLGMIAFLSDVGIILAGGIIFKDVDGIIYGTIINYFFAIVVDKVMYGLNSGKMAMIVTTKGEEIADTIDKSCQRGSTILYGKGVYKKDEKHVVMCACSAKQMYTLEQSIKEVDNDSFVIILQSNEVIGEGFTRTQVAG